MPPKSTAKLKSAEQVAAEQAKARDDYHNSFNKRGQCDFEIIRNSKLCVHNDCVCTITVYTRAGVREKYYYARTARIAMIRSSA
jgi:hypothetical protein